LPLLELARPDGLINRYRARYAKTQLSMDRLYTLQATYYLSFRAQLSAKFVVLCLMFGSGMPLVYFFGACYFWGALYIDRYNLLRNIAPPPRTSAHLTLSLTLIVFPVALGLHILMAVLFIDAIDSYDGKTFNNSSSGEISYLANLTQASETEFVDRTIAVAGLVIAGCLGFFYFYNCSRHQGFPLSKLVSEEKQKLIKQAVLQEEELLQGVDMDKADLDVRARETYLPPLSPDMLNALGLGPACESAAKLQATFSETGNGAGAAQ